MPYKLDNFRVVSSSIIEFNSKMPSLYWVSYFSTLFSFLFHKSGMSYSDILLILEVNSTQRLAAQARPYFPSGSFLLYSAKAHYF